jgi:hypothetical protein
LRARLGLPLVAKDTLKEALGGELGVTERPASHRLGGAVYEAMRVVVHELIAHGVSTIVEGNFTARTQIFTGLPPAEVVQVFVTAEPEVIGARLRARRHRHPVHYDTDAADEIAERARAGEWRPLELAGNLISIDTTAHDADLDDLAARIASSLSATGVPSAEG